MRSPRILFYVQHLLGIGHLARASRVASALARDGCAVTMVAGGIPVPGFPADDVKCIQLPAVTSKDEGFSGLVDVFGNAVDAAFQERRVAILLDIFKREAPDVLIVEAFPFGRRQMRFELMPLLDAAINARPRPLIVTSVRDILQERAKPGRNEETVELIQRYFDLVLVHGDPAFARLEDTFPLATAIEPKIGYSGLVAPAAVTPSLEHYDVIVSAGGGSAGRLLVDAAAKATTLCDPSLKWLIITGPNLPQDAVEAATASASPGTEIARFRRDFASLLASAQVSISQAGYNTVCDILLAGCRSILVPFAAGGETEQTARATRLEQLGIAAMLPEADINPAALVAAIEKSLKADPPARATLRLDGAEMSAAVIRSSMAQRC